MIKIGDLISIFVILVIVVVIIVLCLSRRFDQEGDLGKKGDDYERDNGFFGLFHDGENH